MNENLDDHVTEETHMADPSRYPDADDNTGVRPTENRPPSTPRWVKVFGIIAVVLVLLVVVMMIAGRGGEHGPGRHASSGDAGTPPASVATEDHAPSEGGRG
jgi:hypothetical protein